MTVASLSYFETQYKRSVARFLPSRRFFFSFCEVVVFISCDISGEEVVTAFLALFHCLYPPLFVNSPRSFHVILFLRACVSVCALLPVCDRLAVWHWFKEKEREL